jgi:hypothetical protein
MMHNMLITMTIWLVAITSQSALAPVKAQNIPNADFDSIYIGGIDRVYHWVTSDAVYFLNDTVMPFPPHTYFPPQSSNHHFLIRTVQVNYFDPEPEHYLKSVILYNIPTLKNPDGSQFNSFICNGDHFYSDVQGFVDFPKGGTPFAYRPQSINGRYKFFDTLSTVPDFGKVVALLKRWNPVTSKADTIAIAQSVAELSPSAVWRDFSIPFVYTDTAMPDSVVVVIFSSTLSSGPTSLYIDDIGFDFTSVVNTPARLDVCPGVYPNPCRDELFFTPVFSNPVEYVVYDICGQKMKKGVSADGRISMAGLPSGIYVLLLHEGNTASRIWFSKVE